ncbi:MAG: GrpB family protein [Proteobacteria bacterium]|nr:GrpB family protein [Pseudomonadota bacterium]
MGKNLSDMTRNELGCLFPIILSEPKIEWANLFLQEKNYIISLLSREVAIRVEHIGSTAVPGLLAKPTIDMLVEIPENKDIDKRIISILTSNEYNYMHDNTDHLMFVKGYTEDGFKGQCYHIHMGPKDDNSLWDRIYFRDYLRLNPSVANEYATLKQELAVKYKNDREAYTQAKTDFIKNATKLAKNHLKSK